MLAEVVDGLAVKYDEKQEERSWTNSIFTVYANMQTYRAMDVYQEKIKVTVCMYSNSMYVCMYVSSF